jgi:WD40 repeat protein
MLVTADLKGNVIIWKIQNDSFKLITEISNFSEANITDVVWSPNGELLFISNSNGSVYIIEFNEYSKASSRKEAESKIILYREENI